MVSLRSTHQDTSKDIHVDLQVTLRSRDLRSSVDLDLIRSSCTSSNAYQGDALDGTVIFALARDVKVIGKKFRCPQVPLF